MFLKLFPFRVGLTFPLRAGFHFVLTSHYFQFVQETELRLTSSKYGATQTTGCFTVTTGTISQ